MKNTKIYKFEGNCSECGALFRTNVRRKKTCCSACSYERNIRLCKERAKRGAITKKCAHCGSDFIANSEHKRYCSRECKKIYEQKFHGKRYAEQRAKNNDVYRENFKPLVVPETKASKKKRVYLRDYMPQAKANNLRVSMNTMDMPLPKKKISFKRADGQNFGVSCSWITLSHIEKVIDRYNDLLRDRYSRQFIQARAKWLKEWKTLNKYLLENA